MTTITAYIAGAPRSANAVSASPRMTTERVIDPHADALNQLSRDLKSEADNAKSTAAGRLKRIKEQLEYLKRWGFPPQTVMQQAAQLGHQLGAAANRFAVATGASATAAATIQSGNSDAALPAGYRDTVDEDTAAKPLSASDRETAEDFADVARQLRHLLEEARQKLHSDQASGGDMGKTDLDDTLARLDHMLDRQPDGFAGLAAVMPSL